MIHSLQGGGKFFKGFTALAMTIGTRDSSADDSDYVKEHPPLKYLCKKIGHYLHDFHWNWFAIVGLPPSNENHKQLHGSDIRRQLRHVQHRHGHQGGGRRQAVVTTGLRSESSAALT